MIYWHLFLSFFINNILGYGGGPATIPLIQHDVVAKYGWMTNHEFSNALAFGNSLPGPIATKMAGYIGYEQAGIIGAVIALFATIAPSLIIMILLLNILNRYRDSTRVKRLSTFVLPAITVLMAQLTFDFFETSRQSIGILVTIILAAISFLALEKFKIHPVFVIIVGLVIGGFFL